MFFFWTSNAKKTNIVEGKVRKLKLKKEVKNDLQKIRDILGEVIIEKSDLSHVSGA